MGFLGIIPPISKNSPKYADHPPNAGHRFAALQLSYSPVTVCIFSHPLINFGTLNILEAYLEKSVDLVSVFIL